MNDPVLIAGAVAVGGAFAALARSAAERERALIGLTSGLPADGPGPLGEAFPTERVRTAVLVIAGAALGAILAGPAGTVVGAGGCVGALALTRRRRTKRQADQIGRASCRERV